MRISLAPIIAAAVLAAAAALSCTTAAPPAPEAAAAAAPAEQAVVRAAPAAAPAAGSAQAPDSFAGMKNLALGRVAIANSHIYEFTALKAVDGDVYSYWEGAANAYPDEIGVNLGGERAVKAIRLKLNPNRIWQARKQTFSVLASAGGADYSPAVASAEYVFDPASGNAVTVALDVKAAYIKLAFTANDGATGAQIAELEVYGEP